MNVVPALLGRRRVDWLPASIAGASSVVLLVLDGLGWEAIAAHSGVMPELGALVGSAITSVVPSTTPVALTSIATGLPPSRHGITGFRFRVDGTVLNAIRWQQADGKRPPDPEAFQRHEVFCGRSVPVVTKQEFRGSGLTGAHLRGTEFHGWQTPAILVEHVRAQVASGVPFVYAYYPGVDEVAHAYGLDGPHYPAELAAVDRLVGAVLDALPAHAALLVTADHGQVNLGAESWVALDELDSMVAVYAGDARFRYLHARSGAAAELPRRPRRWWAPTRGCSHGSGSATKGGSGPTRVARRAGASATSCSRRSARSASSTPRSPARPASGRPTGR